MTDTIRHYLSLLDFLNLFLVDKVIMFTKHSNRVSAAGKCVCVILNNRETGRKVRRSKAISVAQSSSK